MFEFNKYSLIAGPLLILLGLYLLFYIYLSKKSGKILFTTGIPAQTEVLKRKNPTVFRLATIIHFCVALFLIVTGIFLLLTSPF